MDEPPWAPDEVDITQPSEARVYDFYLGGSHNFASDRAFGRAVIAACPDLPRMLCEHRDFAVRLVRHLVAAEIDQFLDLGCGLLSTGNVHETAQAVNPAARVVHVDTDPVAVTYNRTLLAQRPGTAMVAADLLDHDHVLHEAAQRGGLDLGRPVAVLALGVLNFVADDARPAEVMAHYLDALVPGSHLAVSHNGTSCAVAPPPGVELDGRQASLLPLWPRSPAAIAALFGDLTLIAPGLVPITAWPGDPLRDCAVETRHPILGGLGRRA